MATIQSTKPGEITGSSVLTGRTPSYRLVLKVDPQTGQYKYEYEVDEAPKAVDTVAAPVAASAAVADPAKKTEEKKTDTTDPKTSFEQTKAALSGAQLREARGKSPEDRGTFQERFGTAEGRGFGFSGGTGTFTRGTPGSDTFTPAPGIGMAFDEFGRKRNIGVMNDLGLNVADTVGKVAKPVQDFVAGGGILGTAKKIADSITGKKEDDTKPTTTGFDPNKQQQRTTFDQTAQALGGTANLGSTRGFFSDLEPARKDIDQQIAELEERAKSPTSPRTFIANEIERLKEQKEKLDPTGQIKLPSDRQPGLDTTTNYRYTIPSGKGGKYIVNFSSRTDLAIDTDAKTLIKVNGNSQFNSFQGSVKPNATGSIHFCGSCILNLSAADYIELFLLQNSGSDQLAYANYCAMSGFRIGT